MLARLANRAASPHGFTMPDHEAVTRYRANLQGEVDGAALYRALAEAETDPRLKDVYGRLAAVEEGHAEFWRKQLDRIGAHAGRLGLGWRTRALAWLARRFGPQFVLPTVNTLEQRDSGLGDIVGAPTVRSLLGDPRYATLMQRLKLPLKPEHRS